MAAGPVASVGGGTMWQLCPGSESGRGGVHKTGPNDPEEKLPVQFLPFTALDIPCVTVRFGFDAGFSSILCAQDCVCTVAARAPQRSHRDLRNGRPRGGSVRARPFVGRLTSSRFSQERGLLREPQW